MSRLLLSGPLSYDHKRVGDLVCALLQEIYHRNRSVFQEQARERGMAVYQLAAALITEGIYRECIRPGARKKRIASAARGRCDWRGGAVARKVNVRARRKFNTC